MVVQSRDQAGILDLADDLLQVPHAPGVAVLSKAVVARVRGKGGVVDHESPESPAFGVLQVDIDVSGRDVADPVVGIGVLLAPPTFHSVGQIEVLLHLRHPVQDPLGAGHDERRPDTLQLDLARGRGLHQVVAVPFESVDARVGVGSQHTDGYGFIPLDIQPLPEILSISNRKLEQTHLVERGRAFLAEPRLSGRLDLLHGKAEVVLGDPGLEGHFMVDQLEFQQQPISLPADRTDREGPGFGGIAELQLVLVGAVLGHRKNGGCGPRSQTFLAGPLVPEASGHAVGPDDQSGLPVFQDNVLRSRSHRPPGGRNQPSSLLQPATGGQQSGGPCQSSGLQEVPPALTAWLPAFAGVSFAFLLHRLCS